jgi:hypothetical protein
VGIKNLAFRLASVGPLEISRSNPDNRQNPGIFGSEMSPFTIALG